jgi:hypothetical protein
MHQMSADSAGRDMAAFAMMPQPCYRSAAGPVNAAAAQSTSGIIDTEDF